MKVCKAMKKISQKLFSNQMSDFKFLKVLLVGFVFFQEAQSSTEIN